MILGRSKRGELEDREKKLEELVPLVRGVGSASCNLEKDKPKLPIA